MEIIEQEKDCISPLLENGMYTNPNGVTIYLDSCGVVTLSLDYPFFYPDDPYTSLSYWKEYPSIEHFKKLLTSPNRRILDVLDHGYLKRQFEKSEIDLSCYVEQNGVGFCLFFRKEGKELFAYDNVSSEMRIVKRNKITPIIIVEYTIEMAIFRDIFPPPIKPY